MSEFSDRIIRWQRQHGRHTLPWQNTRDPYAIWISEIMLQQTQVTAVIPYYRRFMGRFPDVASLARADEDEVLQHWSGLGYYSRARNLHAAAQAILSDHGGRFPDTPEALATLPGIGKSTAAAIAAFAYGYRAAILDGNVKRVLTRYYGIEGWPSQPAIERRLWALASELLPSQDIEAYTQGLMDLGATLCSRSKPACERCPLREACIAHRDNLTARLPSPKPKKTLPERTTTMLLIVDGNDVLLEKRPSRGIWGGLWSLPETTVEEDGVAVARQRFGLTTEAMATLPVLTHSFTHFKLQITPQPLRMAQRRQGSAPPPGMLWLAIDDALGAALPTPVRTLLSRWLALKPAAAAGGE